jgi:hypothetical protein
MQKLTTVGQNIINDIASRYQLSNDAVIHMLVAVIMAMEAWLSSIALN